MRLHLPLSTGWRFFPDLDGPATLEPDDLRRPDGKGMPIRVPGYWQSQFHELARSTGPVWYRHRFALDEDWFRCDLIDLSFGAVGHFAQGWLNGRYLGSHDGGSTPFAWSARDAVQPGTNELWVRCVTPSSDRVRYPDFPFEETLHGKQSWYGPTGGIWQPVTLEGRDRNALQHVSVDADPSADLIRFGAEFAEVPATGQVHVVLIDPAGRAVAEQRFDSNELAEDGGVVELVEPSVKWSLDEPNLYQMDMTVEVGGQVVDKVTKTLGFRTFTADDGQFRLNGRPIQMRGVLDQNYHELPDALADRHEAPRGHGDKGNPKRQLVERFRQVKEMGFNTLRCHIKVPDPAYLEAADEVGLLVWCELPSTTRLNDHSRHRMRETLAAMVRRDGHHPCVVAWTVVNESWGFDLADNPEHRKNLTDLVTYLRSLDPNRLIVDNSPCHPNFHLESDIDDYHFYALFPEMRHQWDSFVEEFRRRPDYTYSPHGDGVRTGLEPLVVSEFGTWGLPELAWVDHQNEPWWFESGQEWAGGAAYVHGYRERFALWHLDKVFGTWPKLCHQTQQRQFDALRYQIDSMRLRPEIAGYVVTELADVHWEANGLFDMSGRPRHFVPRLAQLNAPTRLVVGHGMSTVKAGGPVSLPVAVVNPENPGPTEFELRWFDGSGSNEGAINVGPLPGGVKQNIGPIEFAAPAVDRPVVIRVTSELVVSSPDASGAREPVVATEERSLLVVPETSPEGSDRDVKVRDGELATLLNELGYEPLPISNHNGLRIVERLTDDDHRFVRSGGRLLLLAADERSFGKGFVEFPQIKLKRWDDALYEGGRWVSAFPWLRRTGPLADLPGEPMMDMAFDGMVPELVISGIPPARYEDAVYAGVFVGWIHQVAGLVMRHDVGLGSVVVNTLTFTGDKAEDRPLARWLLHQLIAITREQ